jgi:hypothetical protein
MPIIYTKEQQNKYREVYCQQALFNLWWCTAMVEEARRANPFLTYML